MTEPREDIAELARKIRQIFERRDLGVYEKEMAVAALLRPHVSLNYELVRVAKRALAVMVEFEEHERRACFTYTTKDICDVLAALPSAPLSLESKGEKNDCL